MDLELSVIDYSSPYYQKVLHLRNEVLRKPLGLDLFDEDLTEDRDQYIVVALHEENIAACLMLKILDKDTVKLRQMAVNSDMQRRGFGATLIRYAENFCILNEYSKVELNAREEAVGFYHKLGYHTEGGLFEEVGIGHFKMKKQLM